MIKKRPNLPKSYQSFCEANGSKHIASEYSIEKINELVETFQVKRILEIGLGIGSICGIVLSVNRNKPKFEYAGTEAIDFCLKALKKNLEEDYNRLEIYTDLNNMPFFKKYDLVIIDGKDANLQAIKDLISKNGTIVIEGDRIPQQDLIQKLFPNHKYVHSISLKKNNDYSPFSNENWQGGLKIIFVNPTFKQSIWWFTEKLFTKLKYQFPGRYMGNAKG